MNVDIGRIVQSKSAKRRELASKPVGEKLRIVEELAERTLATRRDTSATIAEEPWDIPSTWCWKKMGDVARVVGGGTPRTDYPEYFGGEIPWITPADLSKYAQKTISHGARSITQLGLENSGAQLLPERTVLFSSRAPIGYVAIAANAVSTNQGFKSFILNEQLEPDFVYYYLLHARELAVALASGTTFLEISGKNAARLPVPVPPLDEQLRIVAEIEKQFTRLEAGVAALNRVRVNVRRYRAAVLKVASEGRLALPEALTREVAGCVKDGIEVLRRIREYRRDTARKAPAPPNETTLPDLPETWAIASLDELLLNITDGDHQPPPQTNRGVPFVVIGNVRSGKLDLSSTRFVSHEYARSVDPFRKPTKGDILYTLVGSFGLAVHVDTDQEFCIQRHIAILRPHALSPTRFLIHILNSPVVYRQASTVATGTAQKTVPLAELRRVAIPLPPITEQAAIVAEVERRLSIVEELEQLVKVDLQRAKKLRQSILQRAFSGDL